MGTGGVLFTFGNLSSLIMFYASFNGINENIPKILSQLTNLNGLALTQNKLVGSIPSSIFNLSSITVIDIVGNQIQGTLPSNIEITLPNLQWLNSGLNLFTGSIPISMSDATKLYHLDFGTGDLNFLNSWVQATNLNFLDLSSNNFGGVFPESISNFSTNLGKLRLQNKKIVGSILTRMGICLLKATDGFSPSNLTGVGSVYEGILCQSEKIVAVKVLNLQCRGASKSFFAECEALRHIKHRNLVKVLTACSSVDYHSDDFKVVVYEFMVNGSLEDWFK
ncbi:probable LRR receptor-like serine/threonine-protein kinase At3g47570 [Camellia sinensis]|uniref:probable LRR receptor-like serine/threonine-protein kinase At3g47570 n=1 Tax=Camellia sinensis TaxID=4442 RepID=UPI001035A1FB|nr:probable LRR receptor-like serine/threonine-protein kinase At3g47570 [Camellia sinensis]